MLNRIFIINELILILGIDVFNAKSIVDGLDDVTIKHIMGTYELSELFGTYLNLTKIEIRDLMHGALLHDIGKSIIPKDILLKKGKLNDKEFEVMKSHVLNFKTLLDVTNLNDNVKDIIFQHHEKVDGSGYPYNLKGEEINKLARIFSLIDVYDALVSVRPYKRALSLNETLELINNGLGCHFDRELGTKFMTFICCYTFVNDNNMETII